MKKVVVASIFSIVILGLGAIGIYLLATEDKEGPEIIFESERVYIEGEDEDALLADVRARDKRDGDVSGSLMIESMMPVLDGTGIRVVYVAKDHSNNITKASRTIAYEKAEEKDTTKENEKKENENQGRIDATERVETTEPTEEDRILEGRPTIELTQSQATIVRGTDINYMNYIQSVYDDVDEEARLWGRVIIEGEPESTNTPGTYEITYQVVDSDEIKSEKKTLILSITE